MKLNIKLRHQTLVILLGAAMFFSCKNNQEKKETVPADEPVAAAAEKSEEWIYLFDGTNTEGWRWYNMDSLTAGCIVKDSTLTFYTELGLEQDYTGGKDIIYAKEEFDNFELYLEWKIPAGGNSGVFYHVKEGNDGHPVV